MSNVITVTRFWCRRDLTSAWVSRDPVPAAGEWCVGLSDSTGDVQTIKIGNGFDSWSDLPDRSTGGGGIPDAPTDGKVYGRKDGDWVEVTSGGGSQHAYWRIYVTDTESTDTFFCVVSEVELAITPGGANIALLATASASSSYPGLPAANATDGSPTTIWSTADSVGGPAWISIALGSSADVKQVRIRAGDNAARAARAPSSFMLQYSDDNLSWTTTAAFSGQSWSASEMKSFSI